MIDGMPLERIGSSVQKKFYSFERLLLPLKKIVIRSTVEVIRWKKSSSVQMAEVIHLKKILILANKIFIHKNTMVIHSEKIVVH